MELESAAAELVVGGFKPIFNRGRGMLHASSPHARNAALLPFLLYVYVSESGHLQVLASDFHSNTWHSRFTYDDLNNLKESLGFKDTFSAFLQALHGAFSSDEVKIELGGPASAVGGKGATCAKLKANFDMLGTCTEMVLNLEILKGRSASDAIGALALDLYDAFATALNQISELHSKVKDEQQKSTNVLDAVLQGKVESIHFRPSTLPKVIENDGQSSWSEIPSSSILMPTQSSVPTISMNSYLTSSFPPAIPPTYIPYPSQYPAAPAAKPYKLLSATSHKKRRCSRGTSLKLSGENSYARVAKLAEKVIESVTESGIGDSQIQGRTQVYVTTSVESETVDSSCGKRKYRELNADLLAKIDAGGENRSAKTDAWARRHYLEWQRDQGLPIQEIEELPLPEFAESLVKFFCMVKKHNGDLFPSDSLKAMYRAFVRIIQSHYKNLAIQGSYSGQIIDPGNDILFEKARLACIEAMKHSLLQGANQSKRKRVDEISPLSAEDILANPDNQATTAAGLVRRLCYYTIHKFHINGNMELYDTTDVEFERISCEQGDAFWEYDEKRAAKYKNKELFRPVVRCNEKDVVECLDTYFMHLPSKPLEEEPRRLFLAPIKRPTSIVWFRHQNISSRTLLDWYRYMGPSAFEQLQSNEDQTGHPPSALRDTGTCDEKESSSGTDLNLPAIDGACGSRQMRELQKSSGHESFEKIVNIPSDTDEENDEPSVEDEHTRLTDVESHEEPNVEVENGSLSSDV